MGPLNRALRLCLAAAITASAVIGGFGPALQASAAGPDSPAATPAAPGTGFGGPPASGPAPAIGPGPFPSTWFGQPPDGGAPGGTAPFAATAAGVPEAAPPASGTAPATDETKPPDSGDAVEPEQPPPPPDTSPPVLRSATVNGASLTLYFDKALADDEVPVAGFAVRVQDSAVAVDSAAVSGRTVILTLATAVTAGANVSVAYDGGWDSIFDRSGNAAGPFGDERALNVTPYPPCMPDATVSCVESVAVQGPFQEGKVPQARVTQDSASIQILLANEEGDAELARMGANEKTSFQVVLQLRGQGLQALPSAVAGAASDASWSIMPEHGYVRLVVRASPTAIRPAQPPDGPARQLPSWTGTSGDHYDAAVQLALFDVFDQQGQPAKTANEGPAMLEAYGAVLSPYNMPAALEPLDTYYARALTRDADPAAPSCLHAVASIMGPSGLSERPPAVAIDGCALLDKLLLYHGDLRQALTATLAAKDATANATASAKDGAPDYLWSALQLTSPTLVGGPLGDHPEGGFRSPVAGVVTQDYQTSHHALDIGAPIGQPIHAMADGRVVSATRGDDGYGWYIIIDHGSGLQTLYAHASAIYVSAGDVVSEGEVIGRVGSTGKSTGPHLHFEVRRDGAQVDPKPYLAAVTGGTAT